MVAHAFWKHNVYMSHESLISTSDNDDDDESNNIISSNSVCARFAMKFFDGIPVE